MITFVIGAGAGQEVNLPTGYELKKAITSLLDINIKRADQLSGDFLIVEALRHLSKEKAINFRYYFEEARHIFEALPQAISIDNFLDAHKGNDKLALCGKLSIVRAILQAERNSLLFISNKRSNSSLDFQKLEETWLIPFFQIITENCTKNQLIDRFKEINLIIYNYDRCVEHYLYYALKNYYRISDEEAGEIINQVNVYHPYGSVGSLPWQKLENPTEFGLEPTAKQLLQLSNEIKTFTEGTNPSSSSISSIRLKMSQTTKLVFLGFAFHKLNMEIIKPKERKHRNSQNIYCYATVFKVSESDQYIIKGQINSLNTWTDIKISNLKCSEFFTEYWRRLLF